ncbi:response regulator of the LytR/AlgR family [Galbibacter orientalis DSM 19592]|uniref:Response regulator of the LytR/AlgR family n=1 Tax=Galbibacter orientalis DSM 19592 TaxID=926559 RepID=I3C0D6_9FLAO|nr:LytTR family transcriptional regulator DNA-binding domain-containing protein [Galbibacter orientalis]EIJ37079.1 response regulator of the LytR/AlgR family [Galbibacter orientalis DSM 19592]
MSNTANKVSVLIVEDEAILAQDISLQLSRMGYEVLPPAHSAIDALKILQGNCIIDIVLLDIMLGEGINGIELAKIINIQYDLPFIFLTSHADKSILEKAKSAAPYAYILKPFNAYQVNIALELGLVNYYKRKQLILEKNQHNTSKEKEDKRTVLHINDSLFLKKENHFEKVVLKEILFLEADSNYTTINTINGNFLYSTVLKKIEGQLPSRFFKRVHRSYVVNITAIKGYEGNTLFINNRKIPVSKNHREKIFNLLPKIK